MISNRPEAAGLEYAQSNNIKTVAIDHKQYASRDPFERALHQALVDADVELICNAGFMRLLQASATRRHRGWRPDNCAGFIRYSLKRLLAGAQTGRSERP